ncbi:MAG TPA: DUF4342 domain-containing protein [Candidatus Bathyarchaeia archaeon]|nr:DUF4342 domain-containing protein [Candidatus Bathyarchaeia archaeon]
MVKCIECGAELAAGARYCSSCGVQAGIKKEVFQVSPEKLIEKFKDIVKDASVKRVVVKNETGRTILSIPVTWGAAGTLATLALAPWLAALGVLAAVATRCTLEVERAPPVSVTT